MMKSRRESFEEMLKTNNKELELKWFRENFRMGCDESDCPTLNEVVEKGLERPWNYMEMLIDKDMLNKISLNDFLSEVGVEAHTEGNYYVAFITDREKTPQQMLDILLKGVSYE